MSKAEAHGLLAGAEAYYTTPAPTSHIEAAFTILTMQPGFRETDAKRIAGMAALFARDCLVDKLSPAQIDYAVDNWRRENTAFMPSYGQFLSLAKQANIFGHFTPFKTLCTAIVNPKYEVG